MWKNFKILSPQEVGAFGNNKEKELQHHTQNCKNMYIIGAASRVFLGTPLIEGACNHHGWVQGRKLGVSKASYPLKRNT